MSGSPEGRVIVLEPVNVIQVLLLFEEKNSSECGLALWAALNEVEAFYNTHEKRMNVRRLYISDFVPSSGLLDTAWRKLVGPSDTSNALDLLRQEERAAPSPSLAAAEKSDTMTYDQERLVEVARTEILRTRFGDAALNDSLMIITDQPITPPRDWHYVIWDSWPPAHVKNAVISIAPLDPSYWGDSDPNRVATIKDRARTAALSVCGEFLGLQRCKNPRCFLYSLVGSVTNLDHMNRLGPEHASEISGLTDYGFGSSPRHDPQFLQQSVAIGRRPPGANL